MVLARSADCSDEQAERPAFWADDLHGQQHSKDGAGRFALHCPRGLHGSAGWSRKRDAALWRSGCAPTAGRSSRSASSSSSFRTRWGQHGRWQRLRLYSIGSLRNRRRATAREQSSFSPEDGSPFRGRPHPPREGRSRFWRRDFAITENDEHKLARAFLRLHGLVQVFGHFVEVAGEFGWVDEGVGSALGLVILAEGFGF
jgi:hypothetical protein